MPPFHPRNRHLGHYQFDRLMLSYPALSSFVAKNKYGDESIDFANPAAVKTLNAALLKDYYGLKDWTIPDGFLCPPIPGRADYIHEMADLLAATNNGLIPRGAETQCLDVGVGANCIYPILGHFEYGWSFVGSDIHPLSIQAAQATINANPPLSNTIKLRLQSHSTAIFQGVIHADDRFAMTLCNPPFHASREEATTSNRRKNINLNRKKTDQPLKREKQETNFGGQDTELWCEGGEMAFTKQMILESADFSKQVGWFSTLVSREENLLMLQNQLKRVEVMDSRILDMSQGQKKSRILAWRFK